MEDLMSKENLQKLHNIEIEILDEIVRICNKNNLTYFLTGGTLLGAVRHKGFIPWDDDLDIGMPRNDYDKFLELCKTELLDDYIVDNKDTNPKYYLNFTKIRKKNTIFEQDFQTNYDGPKGIWVDIFPYDNAISDNPKDIKLQEKIIKSIFAILHYKNGFFLSKKLLYVKKIIGFIFKPINNKILLDFQEEVMKKNNKKESKYMVSLASTYDLSTELLRKSEYFPVKKLIFEGKEYDVPNNYELILTRVYGDYMKLPPKEKQVTHNPVKLMFED